jgi:FkbM family methyltransferase
MSTTFVWNICRRLGLKNLANFGESRQRMLGLTDVPIRTVFDVGANRGRRTRSYRRAFPNAAIYPIEPIPELFRKLDEWARSQRVTAHALNLALGSAPTTTKFYVNRRSQIWSTLRIPEGESLDDYDEIPIQVETLDRLTEQLEVQDEILIKIDTEGTDLDVVQGGRETLRRTAAVIIETMFFPSDYGDRAPTFEDVVIRLFELGFVFRGNLSGCWNRGICCGIDAVFMRRDIARRLAPGKGRSTGKIQLSGEAAA